MKNSGNLLRMISYKNLKQSCVPITAKKIPKQSPWIKQDHNITCDGFGRHYNMKLKISQQELPLTKHNGNIG